MSSRSRGLPRSENRAFGRALDTLTDPGTEWQDTSGTRGVSGTRDVSGDEVSSANAASPSTSDVPAAKSAEDGGVRPADDLPVHAAAPQVEARPKPAPRQHVKLRGDLADQMRDAVWFFSEHGRPRVQLGELLDEAMEAWLTDAKARHNEGRDFPRRGRLR